MEYRKLRTTISSILEATSPLPQYLYHYTSPDAALSILTNQELWASSIYFMNDSSESSYAMDLAKLSLKKRIDSVKSDSVKYNDDTIDFLNIMQLSMSGNPISGSCAISFTELPDALSQWRAYCPKSGGYAIGFPTVLLNDAIKAKEAVDPKSNDSLSLYLRKGFKLIQCIYDPQQHKKIIDEALDNCIKEYSDNIGSRSRVNSPYLKGSDARSKYAIDCINYLREIGLGIKHEGFKEEKEWRIVYAFPLDNYYTDPFSLLSFRSSDKGIMNFMKFSLKIPKPIDAQIPHDTDHELTIKIGPCSNPVQRWQSLMLLNFSGSLGNILPHHRIGNSITPYITW
jgi:hypothetical protein